MLSSICFFSLWTAPRYKSPWPRLFGGLRIAKNQIFLQDLPNKNVQREKWISIASHFFPFKWGLKPCTFQQRNDLQGLHPSFNAQLLAMFFGVISSGHRCLFASPRKTCGQVDSDSFHNGAKSSATWSHSSRPMIGSPEPKDQCLKKKRWDHHLPSRELTYIPLEKENHRLKKCQLEGDMFFLPGGLVIWESLRLLMAKPPTLLMVNMFQRHLPAQRLSSTSLDPPGRSPRC